MGRENIIRIDFTEKSLIIWRWNAGQFLSDYKKRIQKGLSHFVGICDIIRIIMSNTKKERDDEEIIAETEW